MSAKLKGSEGKGIDGFLHIKDEEGGCESSYYHEGSYTKRLYKVIFIIILIL